MTIRETADLLNAEILHDDFDNTIIDHAYTSDLLSDVIANAPYKNTGKTGACALITIQAHINTVAAASHSKIFLIVICNSRPVPDDMLTAARRERIAVIRTNENQFTVSGKLYKIINSK